MGPRQIDPDPDDSFALKIEASVFTEEFHCTICFSVIQHCTSTPCGHSFCSDCIVEWVDRQSRCPSCNTDVRQDQLVRVQHVDRLIGLFLEAKLAASKAKVEGLFMGNGKGHEVPAQPTTTSGCINGTASGNGETRSDQKLSERSEDLLNGYFSQIAAKVQQKEQAVDTCNASDKGGKLLHKLQESLETSLQGALNNFCSDVLATVSIHVSADTAAGSDVVTVSVPLSHSLNDVKVAALQKLDPHSQHATASILEEPDSEWFLVENSNGERSGMKKMTLRGPTLKALGLSGGDSSSTTLLVKAGPKFCYTYNFKKEKGVQNGACNYYTCRKCNVNWICETCSQHCHKGHDLVPHVQNHTPTWACCYCVKKNMCKLPNIKTK